MLPAWVLWSLLASISIAIVSVIDKSVLSNWMADASGSFFVFSVIEVLSGAVALLILGVPTLPPLLLAFALGSGAALSFSTLCYFRAIQIEEVSRVVPLYSLSPLFVAVIAAVFLGEVFPPIKYAGVLLIVAGALLLSLKRLRGFRFGKGIAWMLLSVLLVSAGAVASKYVLDSVNPWTLFAYGKLGTIIAAVPFLGSGARAFGAAYKRFGSRVAVFTGLSEGITSITTIFFLYAGSTGYITLVNALVGTQPFFLLLFTVLLTRYWPKVINEELDGKLLARKLVAILCLFAGAWIIT
jgi:transporter family protein